MFLIILIEEGKIRSLRARLYKILIMPNMITRFCDETKEIKLDLLRKEVKMFGVAYCSIFAAEALSRYFFPSDLKKHKPNVRSR